MLLQALAWPVALASAGVMGLAIQRGATCMVAAVGEVFAARRFDRSIALVEACIWVAGLLAAAMLAGLPVPPQPDFVAGRLVLAGGLLLGLGALVNGACVFGAIARLGSGDWHFALTPAGFYLGSLAHRWLALAQSPTIPVSGSRIAAVSALAIFVPLFLYRLAECATMLRRGVPGRLWMAHHATIVIGIAFVVLLIVAGPWTYSQILTRLANGGMSSTAIEASLFLALLGGAVAGGWATRRLAKWSMRTAAQCLAGGVLMGLGSALIPGGNDNLILVGLPLLQAYAWLAVAAMVAAIWAGLIVRTKWRRLAPGLPSSSVSSG